MSAVARLAQMPTWPARMNADVAALYMGVSKSTFLTRYSKHGRKEGANTLWAKAQLDVLIAKQFDLPQPAAPRWPAEQDDSWEDLR
jgi:hypothetical protein